MLKLSMEQVQNLVRKCYNTAVERRKGDTPGLVLSTIPVEALAQLEDQDVPVLVTKVGVPDTMKGMDGVTDALIIIGIHKDKNDAEFKKILKDLPKNILDVQCIAVVSQQPRRSAVIAGINTAEEEITLPWK